MLDLTRFKVFDVKVSCDYIVEYFHDPKARVKTIWRSLPNESNTTTLAISEEDFAVGENGYSKCLTLITDFVLDAAQKAFPSEESSDTESTQKNNKGKYQNIKISANHQDYSNYLTLHKYIDQQMRDCSADCPDACIVIDACFHIKINGSELSEEELTDLYETTGLLKDSYTIIVCDDPNLDPIYTNDAFEYKKIDTKYCYLTNDADYIVME